MPDLRPGSLLPTTKPLRGQRWLVWGLCAAAGTATLSGCRDSEESPPPRPSAKAQPLERPRELPVPQTPDLSATLGRLRQQASSSRFEAPTRQELKAFKNGWEHLLKAANEGLLPERPAPDGFGASWIGAGALWLLAEDAKYRRGAGAYLLRPSAQLEVILEAPHTHFDQGTLELASSVFEELNARALLINTVHRSGAGTAEERNRTALELSSPADLAHAKQSFFQTAHEALCRQWPNTTVVQIHGYRDEKVPHARMIISAAGGSANTRSVANSFNDTFGAGAARTYPEEVKQLGGTRNVQARSSKKAGCSFLHVELAASLRQQLKEQRALRSRFAQALKRGLSF